MISRKQAVEGIMAAMGAGMLITLALTIPMCVLETIHPNPDLQRGYEGFGPIVLGMAGFLIQVLSAVIYSIAALTLVNRRSRVSLVVGLYSLTLFYIFVRSRTETLVASYIAWAYIFYFVAMAQLLLAEYFMKAKNLSESRLVMTQSR